MQQIAEKIGYGNIITIIVLLLGGAVGWGSVNAKLDEHASVMNDFRQEFRAMHATINDLRSQQVKTDTQLQDFKADHGK
jgi:hypothetical protein